jgi:hypothetical protein
LRPLDAESITGFSGISRYPERVMSTRPLLCLRRSDHRGLGCTLAFAWSLLWMCGTATAGAAGGDAPAALAAIPVAPAVASPVPRADNRAEVERQQRLRDLRRHLLEHSQTWRGDAALRRSAAIPEPTDTPAVVADKILPLVPQPGAEEVISAGTVSSRVLPVQVQPVQVLPLLPDGPSSRLQSLPNAVPDALAAPVVPALPATLAQDAGVVQASAGPLDGSGIADAVTQSDSRLTERERQQLRQQLRQVLRLQEPVGSR